MFKLSVMEIPVLRKGEGIDASESKQELNGLSRVDQSHETRRDSARLGLAREITTSSDWEANRRGTSKVIFGRKLEVVL